MSETEELTILKDCFRKDLNSTSFIPTSTGIALVAGGSQVVSYGLILEALFVWLHSKKTWEEILNYGTTSLGLPEEHAQRLLATCLHVRRTLQQSACNKTEALEILNAEKGAHPEVTESAVDSCLATADEFNVSWDDDFSHLAATTPKRRGLLPILILIAVLAVLYKLIF